MKKTAVITGASGYIGSQVVQALINDGWNVHVILRESSKLTLLEPVQNQVNIYRYNGGIEEIIAYFKAIESLDVVIHLGSLFLSEHSYNQVDQLLQSNIQLGTHILEAMKQIGCTCFINTSTSWQHYNNEAYNPVCLYAATKEAFEKIINYYVEACGFKCITLEIFDSYGPGDPRRKIINLLKECYEKNNKMEMSLGEQELDLVYIEDIVSAYKQAIELILKENNIHTKYSITSQNPRSLKEVVGCIEKLTNTKLNASFGGRPYRQREVMKAWDKGELLPMWQPQYSLEEGLTKVFDIK